MDINKIEDDLGRLSTDPNKTLAQILRIIVSNQAHIEVIMTQQAILLGRLDEIDPKSIIIDMNKDIESRIADINADIAKKIGQ